jgi:lipopolysaccharide transport system ATP-binding protein
MEPDILLVDEALAVGDVSFQKKCMGRMEAVAREGRTVLFVSHNMGAVRSLCSKGIYLEDGKSEVVGELGECIRRYFCSIGALGSPADTDDENGRAGPGFGHVRLDGASGYTVDNDKPLGASTVLHLDSDTAGFYLFCILEDMHGTVVFHLQEASPDLGIPHASAGEYQIHVRLPALWLNPGLYALHFKAMIWGASGSRYLSDKFPVDVQGEASSASSRHTVLHPKAAWSIQAECAHVS